MDNAVRYGLRPFRSRIGGEFSPIEGKVASTQSFDVNGGGSNCVLQRGDVVRLNASGYWEQCDGAENTAQTPDGVVAQIVRYFDVGTGRLTRAAKLPSDVTYSGDRNATRIMVWPIADCWWEIDCDAVAGTGLLTDYETLVGLNASIILSGADDGGSLAPLLDIGTANTTNTLIWRIRQVSPTAENQDFTGANVKMIIGPNLAQDPAYGGIEGL